MKKLMTVVFLLGCFVFLFVSCTGLRPKNAVYEMNFNQDSKATVLVGTNGSQANAIHSPLVGNGGSLVPTKDGSTTPAVSSDKTEEDAAKLATCNGLFVNNNLGARSSDLDATAALEELNRVSSTTAGQNNARDTSPINATQTPTTTQTKTVTTTANIPVSASETGAASSSTAGAADSSAAGQKGNTTSGTSGTTESNTDSSTAK